MNHNLQLNSQQVVELHNFLDVSNFVFLEHDSIKTNLRIQLENLILESFRQGENVQEFEEYFINPNSRLDFEEFQPYTEQDFEDVVYLNLMGEKT